MLPHGQGIAVMHYDTELHSQMQPKTLLSNVNFVQRQSWPLWDGPSHSGNVFWSDQFSRHPAYKMTYFPRKSIYFSKGVTTPHCCTLYHEIKEHLKLLIALYPQWQNIFEGLWEKMAALQSGESLTPECNFFLGVCCRPEKQKCLYIHK